MDTATTRAPLGSVLTACAAFVLLVPVLAVQLRSEWGQVAVTLLAAGAAGFYLGHGRSGHRPRTYMVAGAVLGVLCWCVLLVAAQVFYPTFRTFPGTWFVRFGVGSALVLAAAAMVGDQVARRRSTLSVSLLASVIGIAGGLLTVVSGG